MSLRADQYNPPDGEHGTREGEQRQKCPAFSPTNTGFNGGTKTQLEETYKIARQRLQDMEQQRDELTEAILDLQNQLKWGEKLLASMKQHKKAAE